MNSHTIVFCYRKMIDTNSSLPWEKLVFDDSYLEFRMQFQNINKQAGSFTFAELIQQGINAERLHFLISPAIAGYVQQLQGRIPDLLNTLGKQFLSFTSYRFELINSDIRNSQSHQVAISFYSSAMTWYSTIGNAMLLSAATAESIAADETVNTQLYQLQPFVSIHTLKANA